MAKQTTIDDKANTPAQGAEGAAETTVEQENQPAVAVVETPDYVQAILDSNQAVIDSNQLVINSLDAFKEHSADFIAQLIEKSGVNIGEGVKPDNSGKEQKVDIYASYVVAEGKSFRDNKDFNKVYTEGDDVTAFDEEVLKRLLNQGLIEAVEKEA